MEESAGIEVSMQVQWKKARDEAKLMEGEGEKKKKTQSW